MRLFLPVSLITLVGFLLSPLPVSAQYMYLDVNGDGVNTAADRMNVNGTPTTVDVYLNPGMNRNGSAASCNSGDGALTTINSYVVNLHVVGGSVTFSDPVNRKTSFTIPGPAFLQDSPHMTIGYGSLTPEAETGLIRILTVTITGISGTPSIEIEPTSSLGPDPTSFGTACSGTVNPYLYTLAIDWSDVDGIGEASALPPPIDLTTSGAKVTDETGAVWSEGSAEAGGTGVFNPFLREQADGTEAAFNTDYNDPVPPDATAGPWTHSLTWSSLATVTVSDVSYYSFRLDANEIADSPADLICLDGLKIYTSSDPSLSNLGGLTPLYDLDATSNQEVHISTSLHPGSNAVDMTVLIPKSFFSSVNGSDYLYLYASFGDCSGVGLSTSGGFEEWSALQTAPDQAPSVTAPLAVNGEEGGTLSFAVTASDPDGDAISSLTANLTSLPEGNDAAFTPNGDNTAGTLLWHMSPGDAGTYNVTFTATANDLSASSTTQIDVRLAGANATGVFTWTPQPGDEGVYEIVFSATDEGGTSTLPWPITVTSPILSPAPSAPLAPRAPSTGLTPGGSLAPQAPQAPQKGPIISGTGSSSTTTGTAVTVSVSTSTDLSGAVSITLRAPRILSAARAVQTTTLSVDTSELPAGNNSTFVVDNQPVIYGSTAMTVPPGAPMTLSLAAIDPDGDPIDSFTANLSALPSGNSGTFTVGAGNATGTFTWTPGFADVGTYVLTFTAFNALVGTSSTTITVSEPAAARIFVMDPVKINLGSSRPTNCVYIEPINGSFDLTAVDLSTVKLISLGTGAVSEISAISGKTNAIYDRDSNLIPDLPACFTRADLRALFSLLSGKNTVTVRLAGQLVSGAYFGGTFTVDVIANGPAVGSASIAPNPLNPQAKLSLMLGKGGPLRVTLYDAQGRLVRELVNEKSAMPGPREITIDGTDSKGALLASGVYFFRVESADGVHNGRLAIVR